MCNLFKTSYLKHSLKITSKALLLSLRVLSKEEKNLIVVKPIDPYFYLES